MNKPLPLPTQILEEESTGTAIGYYLTQSMLIALIVMLVWLWFAGLTPAESAPAPAPGWSMPCQVVNVVDGDTIDVDVTYRIRIRLLDCWAPESRTRDLAEKERGIASKNHMLWLTNTRTRRGVVWIPANTNLQDSLTLNRFLGKVWMEGHPSDLSAMQVQAGHATKERN